VVAMASSTDVVGPIANSVEDIILLCEIMAGQDGKDSTVLPDYFAPRHSGLVPESNKNTEITFVRHGQTDANLAEVAGMETSETDSPLNATGVEQSQKTRDELKDAKIDLIISSDFQRAKQTAEIINEYHNVPIIIENDLREIDVPRNLGEKKYHSLFEIDKTIRVDDSETANELFDRVYKVLDKIKEEYAGKNILVVAHGGTHHAFYAYFNKLERKGNLRIDRLHNAGYRNYKYENNDWIPDQVRNDKSQEKPLKIGLTNEFMGDKKLAK
jgi:uncharacterized phosphatase